MQEEKDLRMRTPAYKRREGHKKNGSKKIISSKKITSSESDGAQQNIGAQAGVALDVGPGSDCASNSEVCNRDITSIQTPGDKSDQKAPDINPNTGTTPSWWPESPT